MDFGLHAVTEYGVNHLMPGNEPLAFEGLADDHSLKVMAITLHREVLTGQPLANVILNCLRSHHSGHCNRLAFA